jgi:hypothetical protein
MVTPLQARSLLRFRSRALGWEHPVNYPGIGERTWDALVAAGYLEEKREGPSRQDRFLRMTEKGNRALDEGLCLPSFHRRASYRGQ